MSLLYIPYQLNFYRCKILKKNGKLIIFESYCSIIFQLATIIMIIVWEIQKAMKKIFGQVI